MLSQRLYKRGTYNETYQLKLLIGQTINISKSVVHALTPYFLYILGLQAHT